MLFSVSKLDHYVIANERVVVYIRVLQFRLAVIGVMVTREAPLPLNDSSLYLASINTSEITCFIYAN